MFESEDSFQDDYKEEIIADNGSETNTTENEAIKLKKLEFLHAAEDGQIELLAKLYAEHPEFINTVKDSDGYTPLHRAAYNNHASVCQWLIEKGSDTSARTNDGWEPLHCAAKWGNYETVALLITHGVDVNARTKGNITPLHLSINATTDDLQRRYTTVKYLLETPGVEINAVTNGGDTPYSLARKLSKQIFELIEHYL